MKLDFVHLETDGDRNIYVNVNLIEAIGERETGGTEIWCLGSQEPYLVKQSVIEVFKRMYSENK